METLGTLPIDCTERNPAKIVALACGFIVVGLLAASLISAGPARAGSKAAPPIATSDR